MFFCCTCFAYCLHIICKKSAQNIQNISDKYAKIHICCIFFCTCFCNFGLKKNMQKICKKKYAKNMQKQIFGDGPSVVLWPKDFSKPNSKEHPPGTYSNLP